MNDGIFELELGRIFRHFNLALVLLVAGLFSFLLHWAIAAFLLIMSFGLFSASSKIEIDPVELRYRLIDVFFGISIGSWKSFTLEHVVILKRTNFSQVLNSRGTSVTTNVKTYDLILKNKGREVEIHEFKNYKQAKSVFDFFDNQCGLKSQNAVEIFGGRN